ncbi:hypothetical protein [Mycoplasmopsis bovigenitalium]|nr:hypothetical protein [Mycoplasmopsis bovigenitalium]
MKKFLFFSMNDFQSSIVNSLLNLPSESLSYKSNNSLDGIGISLASLF